MTPLSLQVIYHQVNFLCFLLGKHHLWYAPIEGDVFYQWLGIACRSELVAMQLWSSPIGENTGWLMSSILENRSRSCHTRKLYDESWPVSNLVMSKRQKDGLSKSIKRKRSETNVLSDFSMRTIFSERTQARFIRLGMGDEWLFAVG